MQAKSWGQFVPGFPGIQAVGGVSIQANGLLDNASTDTLGKLSRMRLQSVHRAPDDLREATPLRKVSLRQLDAALAAKLKQRQPLSEELLFLGGLQGIRYVFVYPEQQDIVLVGPAEGWKVDRRGNVVGLTSGRPVMLLEDLLVALRTATAAAETGITCSIDPTTEGLRQLRSHVSKLHTIGDPANTASGIEQALGTQEISFTGVPSTSHFAVVLVAADYRMKRLAMGFEESPVRGMPSFLQMINVGGPGMSNLMQRWWLEPIYEAVLRAPDGLAWELRGAGVKCMTEETFAAANGSRQQLGHSNPAAKKWADKMTEHYAELAVAEPVFGELRNCMELAVVGTLLARENLADRAGCRTPTLLEDEPLKVPEFSVPKHVDSKVSMLKRGRNWIISASGGVAIRASEIVARARSSDVPANVRVVAAPGNSKKWYWN